MEFIELVQSLSEHLGMTLTHVGYSFGTKQEEDEIVTSNSRYEGVDSVRSLLAKYAPLELALWSNFDEPDRAQHLNLYAKLVTGEILSKVRFAYIQFPLERIGHLTSITLFHFVSASLTRLNASGQLDYALVTTMDAQAHPSTYFHGIFTRGLSHIEALNLATWQRNIDQRKTKLRGVYWGNLLGARHLSQLVDRGTFIDRLEALVGSHQLTSLSGDDLFFMLPTSNATTDPVAGSVEALLAEHGLLMEADDDAKKVVDSLVTQR